MNEFETEDLRLKMLDATEKDLKNPNFLLRVAQSVEERLPHKYEYIIASSYCFYEYVDTVLQKRWHDGEDIFIEKSAHSVKGVFYKYANKYCGGRWEKAEHIMIKNIKFVKESFDNTLSEWGDYTNKVMGTHSEQ